VELTPDDVGDISELQELLKQIDADVASITADGASDGQVVYDAIAQCHPKAAVIVPPRIIAVAVETTARSVINISVPLQSTDAWVEARAIIAGVLVETPMFRKKTVISR
jgi:hypothetical protein